MLSATYTLVQCAVHFRSLRYWHLLSSWICWPIISELYFLPLRVKFCSRSFCYNMHSIISIVGIVLAGKENYFEWSWMIKHTLIFNELWKEVCIGDRDKQPEQPTLDTELAIWENKNSKAYALVWWSFISTFHSNPNAKTFNVSFNVILKNWSE